MPNIYTPCTWNMTAAQLVSPTSSQLATVNAIQAAVTASTHWSVNSTGTTTGGFKYVEVKPSNTASVYKDYRILFVEKVINATNKNYGGANPFNSASQIPIYFAPDGGSSWCTFTPANIDSASPPYVGTRYRWGTTSSTTYQWSGLGGSPAWTAIWFYECEGALWLVNRAAATSHAVVAIGACFVPTRSTLVDYNEGGTEIGLPGVWQNTTGWSAGSILGPAFMAGGTPFIWYQTAPGTKSTVQGQGGPSIRAATLSTNAAGLNGFYSAAGGAAMAPNNWYLEVSTSANAGNSAFVNRGQYFTGNMQTRTTIQNGSPAATIGYTFFPDDSATGSATSSFALAFMNTP